MKRTSLAIASRGNVSGSVGCASGRHAAVKVRRRHRRLQRGAGLDFISAATLVIARPTISRAMHICSMRPAWSKCRLSSRKPRRVGLVVSRLDIIGRHPRSFSASKAIGVGPIKRIRVAASLGWPALECSSPNGLSTYSENIDWVGTARGRLGWAQDHWLLYVTGGGAWTRVNTNLAINCPLGCGNLLGPTVGAGSVTSNKDGWVIGAGAEVMLAANWTAKVEYQHLDFGTVSQTVIGAPVASYVTLNDKIRDNIIRFGVNYKFGWGAY